MNQLAECDLAEMRGGEVAGNLPINSSYSGPSAAEIAALFALLTHQPAQHASD